MTPMESGARMRDVVESDNPATRLELMQALARVEREVAEFFGSLPAEEFVLREASAWTPAEHLKHLNTSVSAVARGMSLPRLLLRLRFGAARRPSRTYIQLRDHYRSMLDTGVGATGRYVPEREDLTGAERAARQKDILARWSRVNSRLRSALERWSERDLERIRLPHPLLGMITAREMVFFTIYHNQHHIAGAKRRLPRFTPTDERREHE